MSVSNGGCYRLVTSTFGKRADQVTAEEEPYHEEATYGNAPYQDDVYDEGDNPSSLELEGLEKVAGGRYALSLPMPSVFFKYIIGTKGNTRTSIEKDTKCLLRIPRKGVEGNIVIEGENAAAIAYAKRRVEMVAWSNRFREEPTHFISIPLNCPHIMEHVDTFKDEVLKSFGTEPNVEPDVFIDSAQFHLTLGVARIFSQEEEDKAIKVLHKCVESAKEKLESQPVMISLQGLETMNDDISAAKIVYVKVKACTRLQKFVDEINTSFIKAAPELMRKEFERDGVKLHATLMNCKLLEMESGRARLKNPRSRSMKRKTIDATKILKMFGDLDFGETPLSTVHLSKRFEQDPDGYYKCICAHSIN